MQAQKGEDELAAAALIPRIKRAGLASATPQARDIPQRHADGIRSAGRASRHRDGTYRTAGERSQASGLRPGADFRTLR
jgi:hypothetical protein